MPYALNRDKDIAMAILDVCYIMIIPISGSKVPGPLPNMAKASTAKNSVDKFKIKGLPALVLGCEIPKSNGNEFTVAFGGGLISGKAMGKTRWLMGSTCVFIKGKPGLSQQHFTTQNSDNAFAGNVLTTKQKVVQFRR